MPDIGKVFGKVLVAIKGELVCNGKLCSKNGTNKSNNQYLTIQIRDVSLADVASKKIAKKVVNLPSSWSFPLKYEIEFDASEIMTNPYNSYAISGRINLMNGSLAFVTDERNEIIDHESFTIRSTVNMHMVRI